MLVLLVAVIKYWLLKQAHLMNRPTSLVGPPA
jgi:hypothetical protein